jgi:hypothetical protein
MMTPGPWKVKFTELFVSDEGKKRKVAPFLCGLFVVLVQATPHPLKSVGSYPTTRTNDMI